MNPNVWANETDTELPHGMWLTAADVDNLKHFIQDYTIRSLIPYVEKMVAVLNDAVRVVISNLILMIEVCNINCFRL